MKIPTQTQLITEGLLSFWGRKLLPGKVMIIFPDARLNSTMSVEQKVKNKVYQINYNPRRIEKWPLAMLVSCVFHEIGHVIKGWIGEGNDSINDIIDERLAEEYSLKMMKKYYPEGIKEIIKLTKKDMDKGEWVGKFPSHFQAYQSLKEYAL